ncbi:uncharacterized protein LOC6558562 [Drosophila grimshawi]|uniref:GH16371 n=1 Tax=Drosophila grimshawi TaxID=7222 RepID=B4IYV7_DROGR|nr:uncharacterized protein LOC6558562 [Drosophila grimshawi]EDV96644.1 GH16371 [Drosophila grimshawi]
MQWILGLIVCLGAFGIIAESRQIRINRYAVSVQEDDDQQAQVRELKPTPYPAAGYRPEGRAFWLPGEASDSDSGARSSSDQGTTTTELPLDTTTISSTTEALDLSTTTAGDSVDATTTLSPIQFRSGRAYVKAPYPAAGYRPSRAFLLPTELNLEQQQQQAETSNSTATSAAPDSNANNPVCGVSTNPLKPTPEPGSSDEPDAENVLITANLGPAVIVASAPRSTIPVAIPIRSQPLIQAPARGFAYTTHVEQRW